MVQSRWCSARGADLRLNPHFHLVALDGVYVLEEGTPVFHQLPRLESSEVADVLQIAQVRILRCLSKHGVVEWGEEPRVLDDDSDDPMKQLSAAAVSGRVPAGPEARQRDPVMLRERGEVQVTGALLAGDGGFSLHAATLASGRDEGGREALIRYVLRPPLAQDRLKRLSNDLVRLEFKRPFSDGTWAVDMDPLSLLVRLAARVPPPRFHTVRYSGVLGSASKLRSAIVPKPKAKADDPRPDTDGEEATPRRGSRYRPWAELLKRTFGIEVEVCPTCGGRMKLRALITAAESIDRYLKKLGEPTELPPRAPARAPPYFRSSVVRQKLGQLSLVA